MLTMTSVLPHVYPLLLEDLGQLVEASQAFSDVIVHGCIVYPHLGLGVGQRGLDHIRSKDEDGGKFFINV